MPDFDTRKVDNLLSSTLSKLLITTQLDFDDVPIDYVLMMMLGSALEGLGTAHKHRIKGLSPERIAEESIAMLANIFELMDSSLDLDREKHSDA